MDQEGVFSKVYKHRYRIVKEENGRIIAKDTKWYNVPSSYFQQNANNLGMEVAAKDSSQKTTRIVGPPGYTNYIGNPTYGYWGDGKVNSSALRREDVNTGSLDTNVTKIVADNVGFHSVTNSSLNYWYFYPSYANVRELLQLPAGKIYQKDHTEARDRYHRGFIYYGIITSGGRRRYGTYGSHYSTNTYGKRWTRGGGGYGK